METGPFQNVRAGEHKVLIRTALGHIETIIGCCDVIYFKVPYQKESYLDERARC